MDAATETPGPSSERLSRTGPEADLGTASAASGTGRDPVESELPTPAVVDIDLVEVLRALADPVRLQIVRLVSDGARHCKSHEQWNLGVQKSTLSHHLRILREAGVTRTTIDGRRHWIQLRRDDLDARFPGLLAAAVAGATASAGEDPNG